MFVADYVLMEYGTGALMAVPAHDDRDFEFAKAFDLEIRRVVAPADGADEEATPDEPFVGHTENEVLVNSGEFSGLPAPRAKQKIVDWLEEKGLGRPAVNYRLRDWLLSRQRYWGCPIPIIHCDRCGRVAVPDDQLPVELPEVEDYAPKGKSPLAAVEDWVNVECPNCGGPARRETDTMDTFVDSSWYFLRYLDPRNTEAPWDREIADHWMPVDQYIGGRRARDPPPDVRALLRQGARRPGPARRPGAVREPLHPGDDHPRRGEDVQVEGQHGQPRRLRRPLRRRRHPRLHLLHGPARARRRLDRRGGRGRAPLPRPALAARRRGGRAHLARHRRRRQRRRPRPPCQGPLGDRQGDLATSIATSSSTRRSPR